MTAYPAQFGTGDYQEWADSEADNVEAERLRERMARFLPHEDEEPEE